MTIHDMQNLNRDTISHVATVIKPGMRLHDVRYICEEYMLAHGADSFWYWDVGAFVFSSDETALSVSGKKYKTSDKSIGDSDIITIDLSPSKESVWGDYARTIIIENGAVVENIDVIQNSEWKNGLLMEEKLHKELLRFADRNTTFEELYYHINKIIAEKGYVNLDFMGNLGHSIVMDKNDRIYIEKGNKAKLSSVKAFTFEPHISVPNSSYGYKMENIYLFNNGELIED